MCGMYIEWLGARNSFPFPHYYLYGRRVIREFYLYPWTADAKRFIHPTRAASSSERVAKGTGDGNYLGEGDKKPGSWAKDGAHHSSKEGGPGVNRSTDAAYPTRGE